MAFRVSPFLTKHHILHPNLFPSQVLPARYDKFYAHSLILDMMLLGIKLESWTETEGGTWLPAEYLHSIIDVDRPESRITLWDMTKIHSLLFRYPSGPGGNSIDSLIRWDNVGGMMAGYASERVKLSAQQNPHRLTYRKSIDSTTIYVRGLEFEVEYGIDSHGSPGTPPSWNYAGDDGEPAEVTIWSCYTEVGNGERVDIDVGNGFEKLMEEIEEELVQHVYESYCGDYDPGDDF
jgi:hypothetical protein